MWSNSETKVRIRVKREVEIRPRSVVMSGLYDLCVLCVWGCVSGLWFTASLHIFRTWP